MNFARDLIIPLLKHITNFFRHIYELRDKSGRNRRSSVRTGGNDG
jgi:hypothetical protein